jgi:uncharacterized protein (TIGR02145 family)
MNKRFAISLFLALAAYGQQQERVAILNTVDDGGDSIGIPELTYLTDRFRETAVNVLPKSRYGVMTTESIIAFLGSQERAIKECKAASCLAELGRKVNADYVAQARIGRFEGDLTIKAELYSSKSGNLLGSFTGDSKSLQGLRNIIDKKAPTLFKKLDNRLYLVNLDTEPSGADLSFDGEPHSSSCTTPCKVEFPEGSVRITADLEQYETADTTVSIKQNNQKINIKLKPNFGDYDRANIATFAQQKGSFTDPRDGKKYKTVKIGTQTWMAENLNYNASGSKCYDNKPVNCQKYGRLYNWEMARLVCPKGWHLPSDEEWYVLFRYAKGTSSGGLDDGRMAGKYLKTVSGWNNFNGKSGNGMDVYGFSALPGGYCLPVLSGSYSFYPFSNIGNIGSWWMPPEYDAENGRFMTLSNSSDDAVSNTANKRNFFSVRCVRD